MICETIELEGLGRVIVCSRSRRRPACRHCGRHRGTRQCDFPLTGKKAGKTCDAYLCDGCAVKVDVERDYCPPHATIAKRVEEELGPRP